MSTQHKLIGERVNNPSKQQIRRIAGKAFTTSDFSMKPGYLYTVVRAISARVNQNYDGWPSDELKKSYKSFVGKPVFVNHENYDPDKARGVVVASRYVENGNDKYIEVIQEIDAKRFPKLAREIRSGGLDSVSMGAEAGFTICSYCGNKAFDVPDMCEHVLFHKGEKLSRLNRKTGQREQVLIYESCHKLSFFELSYVFDPADETAVASKVLVAASGVGTGPGKVMRDPQWNRPRNKTVNDTKRRWKAEPEVGDSPDTDLADTDAFDPRSYQARVLEAAGMIHTAADCPPGADCTHHPPSEQISADSANNPLNMGGGSSSGSPSAAPKAIGGGELGKTPATGGTPVAGGSGGVPLVKNPDGSYTSSDPAWAHLIDRESGGQNIKQSPSTHDVNSGGNEAFGIFQETPGTYTSHGGQGSVYDSTPEQQAEVAGNIIRSNPSGSDWGAGLPGREDAAALSSGLSQPKAASFEDRVLKVAGFKQADKCHYCAGDAEEGFSSCSSHRKMEENKFKAAVLREAGFWNDFWHPPMPPNKYPSVEGTHPGASQGWSYDPTSDSYSHPSGNAIKPSDEDFYPNTHQLWSPTVTMNRNVNGPLVKNRRPSSDLQSHFDHVQRSGSFEARVIDAFRKGAPFADYEDFADCESKNKDKGDTGAYCGEIKHRTEDKTGASSPFTDSSGRYMGPMKTKTSYPPSPYGEGDTCPECGQHFTQGHAPGCSKASKWGAKQADYVSDFYGEPDPYANIKRQRHPQDIMYDEGDWGLPEDLAANPNKLGKTADMVPFRDREHDGGRVRAYRNLHNGKWSVRAMDGEHQGRIIGHADELHLSPAQFVVSQAGNQRVRDEASKNVHAFVQGTMTGPPSNFDPSAMEGITYNPYKYTSFVHRDTETPVSGADHVHLGADGKARAINPIGMDGTPVSNASTFEARVLQAAGMHRMPDHPGRHESDDPRRPAEGYEVQDSSDWLKTHPETFEARVKHAWGETEAPAAVDTLREEGSAPEDDNNDFYHYVEPPKELQAPDLSEATQIDREQDEMGQDTDGEPGPASMDAPSGPPQPQQQYMELKIPIPQAGQAGASGAPSIPMQPYQDQPPQQPPVPPGPPAPPGPPVPPQQQIAASTLSYFDHYFGHRVGRINLQTLENNSAGFTKSRNPMKGTANMARSTLASRGKAVTASRRQHFAEGPLVDTGDQSRNDEGEQEEVFITQVPPAEPVDAPTDDTPNISNTENNLVAKVRRGRDQLLRDAQALATYRKNGNRRTAGDQDEAGGPVATEVDPTVNTGPAGEELTGDDFESADPNADVQETQPKDASLHAFKSFDKWLASKTGRPCRQHTSATIRRAADDYSRAAGISVQAMFPALGIVLREARKNEKPNTKGANMRKRADEKLEVAAPDGRIDVEAPTEDTTDAEAQASQFDLHDFGNNAGDNLADPDLSTDQNWAPGEANKTSKKVKTAGGILAFRCAEAMIAAGLEPNTVERKYALAGEFENMNRGLVQSQTALCERFAAVLQDVRRQVASGSTRGANLRPPVPQNLTQQRTAGTVRVAANDPRNDSSLFV